MSLKLNKLSIEFEMENSAFDFPGGETEILKAIVQESEQGNLRSRVIYDINGNSIGEIKAVYEHRLPTL